MGHWSCKACWFICRSWLQENIIHYNKIRKARRFGLCSSTCLCDVSKYFRTIDSRLFNRIQSPSHCLSHLLPPEKHHLALRPRGHTVLYSYPNNLCKRSFIPRCLFCFRWSLNSVSYYCICYCTTLKTLELSSSELSNCSIC